MPDHAAAVDWPLWQSRLLELQARIRSEIQVGLARQELERTSAVSRDDAGDTIFAIDVDAERELLDACETWAADSAFTVVAEGLEPASGMRFGAANAAPTVRVIFDPIDGTRGLMFDKRSAWSLAAAAVERGPTTRLSDIEVAVMTELPTSRQGRADVLWARRDGPCHGHRVELATGQVSALTIRPSPATTIRHGFATVCNFFQGGKELTSRIDEDIVARALDGWNAGKAEVYVDQYISSGGQLAELALGRDRFVLDIRPLVHRALGHPDTLCSRPYDVCTSLIAERAGCVIRAPDGTPLDAPLDTVTNVGFVGYANPQLAASLQPIVTAVLAAHGLLTPEPGRSVRPPESTR